MSEEPTNPLPAASAPETTPVERLIAVEPEMAELSFTPYNTSGPRKKPGPALFLGGVLLPSVVFLLELATGMCAQEFFDPMPTVWHVLIVGFVPAANLYLYLQLQWDEFEYRRWHGAINGIVIVIASVYSLLYLPLLPLAVFALILAGMGILPMAPMIALIASIFFTKHLRRAMKEQQAMLSIAGEAGPPRLRGLGTGIACGVLALFLAEGHRTITYIGMDMAASTDAARNLQGIRLLRAAGHERTMLAACRGRSREFASPFGNLNLWGESISMAAAQTIFYRVTGKTSDSMRMDSGVAAAFESNGSGTNKLDPDRTGEISGGEEGRNVWQMENLALASSRMDGTLDPDAALGYLEWTMVFKNTANVQQEAVSQVQLPPGGVVSRLTLWVNGEEREAAFAGKGQVQAAYDAVVRARRDPVIVQSLGGDRISVRCFPVPPEGEMKIRVGVTAPMQFEQGDEVWMRMPHFLERNFVVRRDTEHAVWFEAKQPIESSSGSLKPEHPSEKLFAVRGSLPHAELATEFPAIRAHRTSEITEAWTRDPKSQSGEIIRQRIEPKEIATPMRAVFVLDGSAGMAEYAAPVANALAKLPENGEFAIVAASDEVVELEPMQQASPTNLRDAAERIKGFKFAGGQDSWPALSKAWDIASQKPDGIIVWIHEPQPISFPDGELLEQRWQRRPGGPRLLDVQTRKGANPIADTLGGVAAVKTVARLGNVSQELDRMFRRWQRGSRQFAVTREKVPAKNFAAPAKETSAHLARLWAFDEVTRLAGTPAGDVLAAQLASTYQLVTPLTGAVVLETQEQYERAGLEPVKPGTTPTVPEPEEWLLMITVALILAWTLIQRRRQWQTM